MPDTVKVVEVKKLPSVDPQRLGQYDRIFVVEVTPGDNLFVRVPDKDFTEEKLRAAIKAELQERSAWAGKEISLG